MHLITGYAGEAHVTANNAGYENSQIFGGDMFVFDTGEKLNAVKYDNNTIRVYDGEGMMNGRHFQIERNQYNDVDIENGTTGYKRKDLIVVRYEKNRSTDVETTTLVAIKGAKTTGTPVAPTPTSGNILDGDLIVDFPLYEVTLEDFEITGLSKLFTPRNTPTLSGVSDIVTDAWSASKTYAVGDYAIYNNSLWKCKVACSGQTPAEGTYWSEKTIAGEFIEANSKLSVIGNSVAFSDVSTKQLTSGSIVSLGSITFPTNGLYLVTGVVSFGANANGYREIGYNSDTSALGTMFSRTAATGSNTNINFSSIITGIEGVTRHIVVRQNSNSQITGLLYNQNCIRIK